MKRLTLLVFVLLYLLNYKIFAANNFTLDSSAFTQNAMIPVQYTCNGSNQSPPLSWHNAPEKTQSFALIVEDPDAPGGVWTHWILFNIPAKITSLDAGSPVPEGAANGQNSWGGLGYRGPCPPIGAHRYVFKLYALDKEIAVGDVTIRDVILQAMTGHVIGSTELVGLYQKQ